MEYKISEMQTDKIDSVVDFHNKYLGKRGFINKEEFIKRVKSNTGIFLVAKDSKNNIIGIKLGYIDKDICIGRGIAVDKKHRRLGVGKSLVKKFEEELTKSPNVKKYIFASSTFEGVPFHIELGYKPTILLQSKDKELLRKVNIKNCTIIDSSYNEDYKIYQVYLKANRDLDYNDLSKLKSQYPNIDIQYLFEKNI
ncbi:MAG: GNAT family N-acetyltransferase [Candidatus Dojkabacteria bacterium]